MTRVGIIGLGYWGPNLARTFASLPGAQLAALCDLSADRLHHVSTQYPNAYTTHDADELLRSRRIDAVVIATPTRTHHALAMKALHQGLHTLVEKPLATSAAQCEDLITLAEAKGAVLSVGHVFLHSAPVVTLKKLIASGELGNICYISSVRLNLGPVRHDVNALWDLATHDISIVLHLMDTLPVSVNCQGMAYLSKRVHDVCSLTLQFPNGTMALIHVSWLDPNKRRLMTVVGDKKMAVFDDIEPLEKIKLYDKGVEPPPYTDSFADFQYSYRYGDTYCPRLQQVEPLKAECQHFLECIREGKQPKTDGRNGLDVVRVLQAAQSSLLDSGGRVEVQQYSQPAVLASPISREVGLRDRVVSVSR